MPLDCASGLTTSSDRPQTPSRTSAIEHPTTRPPRSATQAPPGSVASRWWTRTRPARIGPGGSGGSPKRRLRSWKASTLMSRTASTSATSSGRTDGPGTTRTLECAAVERRDSSFTHAGRRLVFSDYGDGPRVVVLLHGLLFSRYMHDALARALAERGHHVLTLDLLGHGESDRPTDMWRYSMTEFGREVVALLDHLEIGEAAVMGTSLGANTTLEVASLAPDRLRAMVIEMPVLDHALLGSAVAFTPLMLGLTFGAPVMRALARTARHVPARRLPWQIDILVDWIRQDPEPSAAVIQGLFFGRTAPHRDERRRSRRRRS